VSQVKVCCISSIEEARMAINLGASALLLDSGNPSLEVKELGGTGRTHDWTLSAQIVAAIDKPVFLAGGLRPNNVATAIQQVRPYGVDLCRGVRSQEQLDRDKLTRFMTAVGLKISRFARRFRVVSKIRFPRRFIARQADRNSGDW
jgi:phosphoribosylanthranilate isomerase